MGRLDEEALQPAGGHVALRTGDAVPGRRQ